MTRSSVAGRAFQFHVTSAGAGRLRGGVIVTGQKEWWESRFLCARTNGELDKVIEAKFVVL